LGITNYEHNKHQRDNITVDAVVEIWKKEFSDGRHNDITDYVWCYVLGDWSKDRQNNFNGWPPSCLHSRGNMGFSRKRFDVFLDL